VIRQRTRGFTITGVTAMARHSDHAVVNLNHAAIGWGLGVHLRPSGLRSLTLAYLTPFCCFPLPYPLHILHYRPQLLLLCLCVAAGPCTSVTHRPVLLLYFELALGRPMARSCAGVSCSCWHVLERSTEEKSTLQEPGGRWETCTTCNCCDPGQVRYCCDGAR
jgi:hypothetical protein